MEQRVLFIKKNEQRKFLDLVISNLNIISLRGIIQLDSRLNYSTLKNYYSLRRLLPKGLYLEFCRLARIDENKFNVKFIDSNWGQVLGGKR